MAVLHGSWLLQNSGSYLFIWGETWRSLTKRVSSQPESVPSHPLAMTQKELSSFLQSHRLSIDKFIETRRAKGTGKAGVPPTAQAALSKGERWIQQTLALPTPILATGEPAYPDYSGKTYNDKTTAPPLGMEVWQVEGLCLEAPEAVNFLQALPLSSFKASDAYVGPDLRFWVQVCRWSLDILARGKFLPGVHRLGGSVSARWQPLLDAAVDRERLEKFALLMPSACRAYQPSPSAVEPLELLLGFLSSTIDARVRVTAGAQPLPASTEPPVLPWLKALSQTSDTLEADAESVGRLSAALRAWTTPVQEHLVTLASQDLRQQQFRACFSLQPPLSGEADWTLEYCLQAVDAPEFLVDAQTIWNHPVEHFVYQNRTIEQPQETFLKGLGLASRLYAPIEPSLQEQHPQSCRLNPIEAYEFIKGSAWRLQNSGLGVVLPPSLMQDWSGRLGLKIKADLPKILQNQRLGLKSLLKLNVELAIGDRSLSKQEFERLMAQQSPLVEVNGAWVALQPQDVRAAEKLLKTPPEQIEIALQDAMHINSGDSKTIEKLPVLSFEASGVLQELMGNLADNQAIAPIEPPASFRGQLRPYQARGAGWLAFLERWGLGACLADDMGVGKCAVGYTLVAVNGILLKAENIWDAYAIETQFDGEGFWATPRSSLLVNSINEETGQIELAPIRRLYRQRVCEKLRTVKLKDGSSITITRPHKLLTRDGWNNDLQVGDYVCVPAKMIWSGQPEDPDLVKFLAWQIAEGHERPDTASLSISQKDFERLEDLLQTVHRIAQRYNLKINRPAVHPYNKAYHHLRLHSQAYRRFLEAKGYCWGKLSRDKSIPPFIMQADLDSIRIFLSHYFDAESAVLVSQMRSIEISSASPMLIQQLSVLLRRFGIWLRITQKQKCATNGTGIFRTYQFGTIGGNSARRFLQEIGFTNTEKQRKLEEICQKVSNTNVEGIPASDIVAQVVEMTKLPLRHFGMHNTVYINGSQQFSRTSLSRVLVGFERILSGEAEQEYRQLKPSKWTTMTLESYAQLNAQQLNLTRESLQSLLDREVFYCEIEAIEDVEYDGWVYDFEVSDRHNFVANNILCHNTIQTIAFLLHLQEQKALEKPTLLVCPTSVLGNWEREVHKFGPTLKTLVHYGDKRLKGKAFAKESSKQDLVITSYSLVYRDAKTFEGVSWQVVVLDEAQNIKNPDALQSQAVRKLSAEFRMALTGTPVENRLAELWSILDFLNPGYLGNRKFFQDEFATKIEKNGDANALQLLRSLVQPFILRRLKTDRQIIQDLPEKQETPVFCRLSAEQSELYQNIKEKYLDEIDEATGIKRRGLILALLVKIKQIFNHPALFLKEKHLGDPKRSGKLPRLVEMLEELISEGNRALIFTQFAEWGKLLKPYLEEQLGGETLFLYGGTRKQEREEMIDRFQNDPSGPRIFILSLKAGGTGINLTRANHVFHYDRWWNPAVENQATDRVFRIGQTRNVQVHKFITEGTYEETINEIIESKKELAEQTVNAGEDWLTEMDTDQLRSLLLLDRSAVIDEEES